MAHPAPHRRPDLPRAFRLRVEPLDDRCVMSATPLGPDLAFTPVELSAAAVLSRPAAVVYGPLMTVPLEMADGRNATVDWGDGLVTPAILVPGDDGVTVEVWAERAADPNATYRLTVTLTDVSVPTADPVVVEAEFAAQPAAGTGVEPQPPVAGFEPGTPAPPRDIGTDWQPPEAAELPPPFVPHPTTTPAAPFAAGPALPTPRTESPFRAGEVQVLATVTVPPRPPAFPLTDPIPSRTQVASGRSSGASLLATTPPPVWWGETHAHGTAVSAAGGAVAVAFPPARIGESPVIRRRGAGDVADESHAPVSASTRAAPVVQPSRILSLLDGVDPAVNYSLETPTTAADEVTARGRTLVAAYATEPVPDAVFLTAPDDADAERSETCWPRPFGWVKRGVALLATAVVGYRMWVPRIDPLDDRDAMVR